MEIQLECTYCGKKWTVIAYNKQSIENEKCGVCGDVNLKVRDLTATKIDSYKGCPPFPQINKRNGLYW